ncbi:hypothetical protein [Hymenobacter sp. GOD-10R]|uniref:hypothetical protein n=1 Tax=Hymenobacter sp. GOD-10R TaxID=3093922 RepID=UPI002D7926CC|nr:hypothetical protein [Hymenobacter sp. GOD-10R]WRQ30374.1 hypothetical protein SD425_08885 [Hymenobacter sp. GOD-10R]
MRKHLPYLLTPCHPRSLGFWLRYLGCLAFALECNNGFTLNTASAAESPDAQVTALLRQRVFSGSLVTTTDAAQVAQFYGLTNYLPVWTRSTSLVPEAWTGLQLLSKAADFGLKATDYKVARLRSMFDSLQQEQALSVSLRVRTEQQLTAELLRFARHLRNGRINDTLLRPTQSGSELAFDPVVHVLQALRSGQFSTQLLAAQPTSRSYVRLRWAWQRLLQTDSVAARRLALPVALNLVTAALGTASGFCVHGG